ncbi:MAG: hypothetical protein AVDCRST_MAG73-198, partial [uncultured Thermomicrobiales bacterium]
MSRATFLGDDVPPAEGRGVTQRRRTAMETAKRIALALTLASALGASMVGDVSAGKEDGQAQREARSQAGG